MGALTSSGLRGVVLLGLAAGAAPLAMTLKRATAPLTALSPTPAARDGDETSWAARHGGLHPSPLPIASTVSPAASRGQRAQTGDADILPRANAGATSTEGLVTEAAVTTVATGKTLIEASDPGSDGPGDALGDEDKRLNLAPTRNSARGAVAGCDDGHQRAAVAAGHLNPNGIITGGAVSVGGEGANTGAAAAARAAEGAAATAAVAGDVVATGRPESNPGGGHVNGRDGDNIAIVPEGLLQSRPASRITGGVGAPQEGEGVPHQSFAEDSYPVQSEAGTDALLRGTGVRETVPFAPPPHDAAGTSEMVREELGKISRRARRALEEVRVGCGVSREGWCRSEVLGGGVCCIVFCDASMGASARLCLCVCAAFWRRVK